MKKILIIAASVALIAIFAFKPSIEPLPIGAPVPEVNKKMMDISGRKISFNDVMKKNGLLIVFSCNTCPIVKAYQSRTAEVCKYAGEKQVGVILLNSNEGSRNCGDSFEDMKDYAGEQEYKWPYVLDKNSEMANVFGASRTPECFLFNAEGKLVYHGAIDNNANGPEDVTRKHLIIAIDEMLVGKDVSAKITRSVGCTIQRPG
jgi:hypothetical protein